MNNKRKIALGLSLMLVASMVMSACGGEKNPKEWAYPDKENTVLASGEFSWEKWKQECPEGLTINWYSDTMKTNINNKSVVTKAIKEKTGITVNFDMDIGDGTDKLSLMIGGDTLPDVITMEATDNRFVQLANQKYLFPINGLAEKWAPTLEVADDIMNVYGQQDGNLYGLPSDYYLTDENVTLQTNGGMMIRKDWYEAYMEYVIDNIPASEQSAWDITHPDGLIKAMGWVKDNCLTSEQKDTYNAFLLDPFIASNNNGNQGIAWLCQYFAVPYEDAEGNYIDGIDSQEYLDLMKFLNELYNKGYLTSTALSATSASNVGKIIANGQAFVVCGTPQDYPGYLVEAKWPSNPDNESVEYVSFVLKNYDGDDPVLGDIAGTGYEMTCITKNAKRPDIIIKLFDYLWSEEGQKLCKYGIEGVADQSGNITAVKDPALAEIFTVDEVSWYENAAGEVKYAPQYLEWISSGDMADEEKVTALGLGQWNMFRRPTYLDSLNTGKKQTNKESAYVNNMKLPLSMYSTSYHVVSGLLPVLHEDYTDLVKVRNKMNTIWSDVVIMMIKAKDYATVQTIFSNGRKRLTSNGHDDLYAVYNQTYRNKKEKFDIAYGYPKNDPNYVKKSISQNGVYTWEKNGKVYTDIFGARGDISYYYDYEIV